MADDTRVTQDGDTRITQNGDTRITEEGLQPAYLPWGPGQVFVATSGEQTLPGIGPGQIFVATGTFQTFSTED